MLITHKRKLQQMKNMFTFQNPNDFSDYYSYLLDTENQKFKQQLEIQMNIVKLLQEMKKVQCMIVIHF